MVVRRVAYRYIFPAMIGCLPACAGSGGGFASGRQPPSRFALEVSTAKVSEQAPTQFASMIRQPGGMSEAGEPPGQPSVTARALESTTKPPTPDIASPRNDTVLGPPEIHTLEQIPPLQPPETDPPLVAALRAQIAGRPELAAEHLRVLDKANQELLLQILPAMVRTSQASIAQTDPQEAAKLAGQLEGAAAILARRASLSIEKAVFCRSVKTFGHYDPIPHVDGMPVPFKPGDIYILYVEIGNAPSEPVEQNGVEGHLTRLACSLELRDAEGKLIELTDRGRRQVPALSETKNDISRSPVRDYFMLFWFAAPSRPGQYSVKFTVQDPAGGREVSRRIPFRVQ